MKYNLRTADFELLRGLNMSDEIDGAAFRWDGGKFEIEINLHPNTYPNFQVLIGHVGKLKKRRLQVKSEFVMVACPWEREALSTELILNHTDELKKFDIGHLEELEPLELPEKFNNDEAVKQRFADMANRYQKEKAEGKPPHLFKP